MSDKMRCGGSGKIPAGQYLTEGYNPCPGCECCKPKCPTCGGEIDTLRTRLAKAVEGLGEIKDIHGFMDDGRKMVPSCTSCQEKIAIATTTLAEIGEDKCDRLTTENEALKKENKTVLERGDWYKREYGKLLAEIGEDKP